jgi:DNA-directed RNA polymerase subunit RPC12/RpoP
VAKDPTAARTDVSEEFGRRYLAFKRSALLALGLFGATALSIVGVYVEAFSGSVPIALVALAMAALFPFAWASSRYCCPACGAKPEDDEGDEMLFTPPLKCRECGARLLPLK